MEEKVSTKRLRRRDMKSATVMHCQVCDTPCEYDQRMHEEGKGLYKICMMCGAVHKNAVLITRAEILESEDRTIIEETLKERRGVLNPGGPNFEVGFYTDGVETLRLDIRNENWALDSISDFLNREVEKSSDGVEESSIVRTSPWQWEFTRNQQRKVISLEPAIRCGAGSMEITRSKRLID